MPHPAVLFMRLLAPLPLTWLRALGTLAAVAAPLSRNAKICSSSSRS